MPLRADQLVKVGPDSDYAAAALAFRSRYAQWCVLMGGENPAGVNVATFHFDDDTHATMCSENVSRNCCAEQALEEETRRDLFDGKQIAWVFTEREPCGPNLHNCSDLLMVLIERHGTPDCKVYYIWDYPDAENRKSATKRNTKRDIAGMSDAIFTSVERTLRLVMHTRSSATPQELMRGSIRSTVRPMD